MNELQKVECNGIIVLTTQQIAEAYGTDTKIVSYNFNHNKDRYEEGKHFICLTGNELRAFRENHDLSLGKYDRSANRHQIDDSSKYQS